MLKAGEVLREAAQTFDDRNLVYGDNFRVVGKVMTALFPDGINLEGVDDHNRFHIFMLTVVKLTRYANNFKTGGHHDSSLDAAVYWAMLDAMDGELNQSNEATEHQ